MSEHGWPDGHDDGDPGYGDSGFGDHGYGDSGFGDPGYGDPFADPGLPGADDVPPLDDAADVWGHDDVVGVADDAPEPAPGDDASPPPGDGAAEPQPVTVSDLGPVGADPDAAADGGDAVGVFPPVVDVGPLPEPVDGFPWIDTGSLGLAAAGPLPVPAEPVDPQELAAYAAADLPPGVDPWAALADSDDPATSALARWWAEHGH
jgi:hypothetical protein